MTISGVRLRLNNLLPLFEAWSKILLDVELRGKFLTEGDLLLLEQLSEAQEISPVILREAVGAEADLPKLISKPNSRQVYVGVPKDEVELVDSIFAATGNSQELLFASQYFNPDYGTIVFHGHVAAVMAPRVFFLLENRILLVGQMQEDELEYETSERHFEPSFLFKLSQVGDEDVNAAMLALSHMYSGFSQLPYE